ncbi:uncharacterized protein LOC126699104 [Quercus robur]|uniref:uncharacterized protein LOC126699104 n=1 Tax=Quercus robur TaxID=38942 RepID=UPI002162573B|nr:uncharacterized protein LOC126699104 [Quercus robur]
MGSQQQGNSPDPEIELNRENERNLEGSVHVTQMNRSPSQHRTRGDEVVQQLENRLHRSYKQLTQAFGSRFIMNSRAPLPLSSLLSLSMREGEILKAYSDKYWEMYNEIDDNYDDVAISTFKSCLPTKHDLRKSLTGKPVTSIRQLMDRIDKYKRVEEDQLQRKGKEKIIPHKRNDFRSERYNNNHPRRDFAGQLGSTNTQIVNAVFKEPIHQVLEKVKNEPFFKWPNKMAGDSSNLNQSLYC